MRSLLLFAMGILAGGAGSALGFIGLVASGYVLPTLSVRELRVGGPPGTAGIVLTTSEATGPSFVLSDAQGAMMVGIGSSEEGGRIEVDRAAADLTTVLTAEGLTSTAANVSSTMVGAAGLNVADSEGVVRLDCGAAGVNVSDSTGTLRAMLALDGLGAALRLYGPDGSLQSPLGTASYLRARLIDVVDEAGDTRIRLSASVPKTHKMPLGEEEVEMPFGGGEVTFPDPDSEFGSSPLSLGVAMGGVPSLSMNQSIDPPTEEGEEDVAISFHMSALRPTGLTLSSFSSERSGKAEFTLHRDAAILSLWRPGHVSGVDVVADSTAGALVRHWDEEGRFRLVSGLQPEYPKVLVFDEEGRGRANLGVAETVNKKTGAETTSAESCLTLFDKEGTVIYQVP